MTNLNLGANTLSAYVVDNSGKTNTDKAFTFKYVPSAKLGLITNGSGKVTPNDGGKWLEIGKKYTLKAAPSADNLSIFSNWVASGSTNFVSNSLAVSFTMQSNLVLTANFVPNPFLAEKGTFSGLFMSTNASDVTEAGSGFFTLNLTSKGAFTGKITLPGGPYSFASNFDAGGQVQFTIPHAKPEPLTVNLQLDIQRSDQRTNHRDDFQRDLGGGVDGRPGGLQRQDQQGDELRGAIHSRHTGEHEWFHQSGRVWLGDTDPQFRRGHQHEREPGGRHGDQPVVRERDQGWALAAVRALQESAHHQRGGGVRLDDFQQLADLAGGLDAGRAAVLVPTGGCDTQGLYEWLHQPDGAGDRLAV